ncbi:hypothetical protein [uncultured Maribacter sp.]|uniref:hypothetical protein n=1 Tax=uncultured Maribacter sp. TaxID=431308 RepID=UPI0030EB21EB|tara:strand:- start:559 stop:753 length:195 start_codon:yes stop_codon:yes gene_type:complete
MDTLLEALKFYDTNSISILDTVIPIQEYVPLNLSKDNKELLDVNITDPIVCLNRNKEALRMLAI